MGYFTYGSRHPLQQKKTATGEIFNEFPDRIADTLLIVALLSFTTRFLIGALPRWQVRQPQNLLLLMYLLLVVQFLFPERYLSSGSVPEQIPA
ncbi:hypothetical protein ACM5Q9_08950 [Advenella sp. RU8]|uniref:hypothetical protein n=1 Tax=Advenella sp. RU8 TaxID=3399575 RepID=UPI003AAA4A98